MRTESDVSTAPTAPAMASGGSRIPPIVRRAVSRPRLIVAFAAIYLIWGSTYLAIRFAIETMPPLMMAGVRHFTAGLLMFALCRAMGMAPPTPRHWVSALAIGGLLLLGGNGAVSWAVQLVPSGLAALVIATVPLWIALLEWRIKGVRPGARAMFGIALGLAGVALLIGPGRLLGGQAPNPIGVAVLLTGAFAWSVGSLYARRAPLPPHPLLVVSSQMIAGGALLLVAGFLTGEGARVNLGALSVRSVLAFAYLIVFGSIVGYTAYIWLLRVTAPERVATYAFVNPVVAVLLGWAFAGEPLTPRTQAAAAVIVAAVVLVTWRRPRRDPRAPEPGAPGAAKAME